MSGNDVVLYITLGFILICFVAWLWQSIVKRRRLEDDIASRRDAEGEPGDPTRGDEPEDGAPQG